MSTELATEFRSKLRFQLTVRIKYEHLEEVTK